MSKPIRYILDIAEATQRYIADYNRIMDQPEDPDMLGYEEQYIEALHDVMFSHFEFKDTGIESYYRHLGEMRELADGREVKLEACLREYAKEIFDQLVEYGLYDEEGNLVVAHSATRYSTMLLLDSKLL